VINFKESGAIHSEPSSSDDENFENQADEDGARHQIRVRKMKNQLQPKS